MAITSGINANAFNNPTRLISHTAEEIQIPDASASDTAIYVSPSGSDNASGNNPTQPVKTLERAVELLTSHSLRGKQKLEIIFREGTYEPVRTISLGNLHSGSPLAPVIFKA
jgi:hypothetical protein